MPASPDFTDLANLDYVARVNRALDFIIQNLTEPLNLEQVAKVACFSPYHFHRIFKSLVGETLNAFIKRVRLEKAVHVLSYRDRSLTEVALACGFSSSSDFSRSFRAHYGVPPSAFDVDVYRASRRENFPIARLPPGENPDGFTVSMRDYPSRRVAYLRVHRSFEAGRVEAACRRLLEWAKARGLDDGEWLGYMWDDPEIVALERCRYDVAVVIPPDADVDEEVGTMTFAPMNVAEIDIAGPIELEQRAIDWLYGTWLPTSGYAPDDQPGFEAWNGKPFAHGDEHFELRVQLPIVDAAAPL